MNQKLFSLFLLAVLTVVGCSDSKPTPNNEAQSVEIALDRGGGVTRENLAWTHLAEIEYFSGTPQDHPQSIAGEVSRKSIPSTDYVLEVTSFRGTGFSPARVAHLFEDQVVTFSLQNLEEIFLVDTSTFKVTPFGYLPFEEAAQDATWVWPRILKVVPISVEVAKLGDEDRLVSASVLIAFSIFDGSPGRRCQFVSLRELKLNFDRNKKHEFGETWFDSVCVPEEIGVNHSWESGGGIDIVPPALRNDPDRLELVLALGHFHAMQPADEAFRNQLSDQERDQLTSVLRFFGPRDYEIVANGFRNTQGIAYVTTGDAPGDIALLGTDHGPYSGDEINKIVPFKNYGWPFASFGRRYDTGDNGYLINWGVHDRFERPIYFFADPAFAAAPIIQLKGPAFSGRWSDVGQLGLANVLVGAMSRGALARVLFDGERVLTVEMIDLGFRPRDLLELPDGVIISSDDGLISKLRPVQIRRGGEFKNLESAAQVAEASSSEAASSAVDVVNNRQADVSLSAETDANLLNGEAMYARCVACHKIDVREHGAGPHLVDVFNRSPSDVQDYNYSPALADKNPVWTYEALDSFLTNPRAFAPGTTMTFSGIKNDEDRRDLIAYILSATEAPKEVR